MAIGRSFLIFSICITLSQCLSINPKTVTTEEVRDRLNRDFLLTLHGEIGELQLNNMYNMVKLYTHGTLEQSEQVVEYIASHANLTREEGKSLRMAGNATVAVLDCIRNSELRVLQAYRNSGYTLHNCIRQSQISYEKLYTELHAQLDLFKIRVDLTFNRLNATIDNCVDRDCLIKISVAGIMEFEKMRDDLGKEVVKGNNLNVKYILSSIAGSCVSNSLTQIHQSYKAGKELLANCFHVNQLRNQYQTVLDKIETDSVSTTPTTMNRRNDRRLDGRSDDEQMRQNQGYNSQDQNGQRAYEQNVPTPYQQPNQNQHNQQYQNQQYQQNQNPQYQQNQNQQYQQNQNQQYQQQSRPYHQQHGPSSTQNERISENNRRMHQYYESQRANS